MRLLLATAALAMVPAIAQAQDAPIDDKGFSGLYAGGSVGLSNASNRIGESVLFDRGLDGTPDTLTNAAGANAFSPGFCNGAAIGPQPGQGCINDKDDIDYAARVGFDIQLGSGIPSEGGFVIGAVGEFGKAELRDSVSAFSTMPASYTFNRELDWYGSIRARAGFTPNGATLFYGTGGPAYARINNSFSTSNTTNAFAGNGKTESWGWMAGGGAEQKLGRHFSIGLEYMYSRFNDDDYRVRTTAGTAPATSPFILNGAPGTDMYRQDDRFDFHTFRATAAFRF